MMARLAVVVLLAVLAAGGAAQAQMDGTEKDDKLRKVESCFERNLFKREVVGVSGLCTALVALNLSARSPKDWVNQCVEAGGPTCRRQCIELAGFFADGPWSNRNTIGYRLRVHDCRDCFEQARCVHERPSPSETSAAAAAADGKDETEEAP